MSRTFVALAEFGNKNCLPLVIRGGGGSSRNLKGVLEKLKIGRKVHFLCTSEEKMK